MKLEIRKYGDPVLREKAGAIEPVNEGIRSLAEDMIETMHAERGVGLAAQQIGKTVAICVIHVDPEYDTDQHGERLNPDVDMPLVLINPAIEATSEATSVLTEGCLSFPGIDAPIERPVDATVRALDIEGEERVLDLKGFVARVAQHEIDHLNGVLFIDRMKQIKKIAVSGKLKRMRRETREALGLA